MRNTGSSAKAASRRGKQRRTPHRTAVSNSEVQQLIQLLRKRWKYAKGEERRGRVTKLLSRGCSIRGLAHDIHQAESVVRYYSEPAPDSPRRKKTNAPEVAVSGMGNSKEVRAVPARKGPGFSNDQSDRVGQPPASVSLKEEKTKALSAPSVDGRATEMAAAPGGAYHEPLLKNRSEGIRRGSAVVGPAETGGPLSPFEQVEPEETLESLRLRLPEIIVDFILKKLGPPEAPGRKTAIQALLGSLRVWSRRQPPSIYPRHLEKRLTIGRLYELTGVNFQNKQLGPIELGEWLAVLLASLAPRAHPSYRTSPWEPEIEQAERQLLPSLEPATTTGPVPRPKSRILSVSDGEAERRRAMAGSRTRGFFGPGT
jgi:hypothetical protein